MRALTLSFLAAAVALPACRKNPPPEPTPAPPPVTDDGAQARAEAARRAREDSLARVRAAEEAARLRAQELARMMAALRDTLTRPVHFDFDRSDIRPDDQPDVDRKLAILLANPRLTVRIAGHADERGSDEYNLALGARRAAAVSAYLRSHGIEAGRLETVSYGEEQPVATGQDEWSWAQNRRAVLEPMAGADSLAAPQGGQ